MMPEGDEGSCLMVGAWEVARVEGPAAADAALVLEDLRAGAGVVARVLTESAMGLDRGALVAIAAAALAVGLDTLLESTGAFDLPAAVLGRFGEGSSAESEPPRAKCLRCESVRSAGGETPAAARTVSVEPCRDPLAPGAL